MKVEIQGLFKSFDRTEVLRGLDVTVAEGEFFFILGPSGCGKTTLLRIIAGFEYPTSGEVYFDGQPVRDLPPNRRNIGMVFQNYALWPHLSVRQNVQFGLDVLKVPRPEALQRVNHALEMVRMEDYADRFPNQLSGGQQQRIALARAVVTRPGLLLLDEPLSNLDAKLRHEMRDELARVQKATGITTVYVTHDQKEALSMADRMIILKEGRIMQAGSPIEVYQTPQSAFVAGFMGETNFIRGTVVGRDEREVRVVCSLGTFSGDPRRGRFWLGQEVQISIRPEALRLAGSGQHDWAGTCSATVERTVFMGEVEHFWLNAGDLQLKMLMINPKPGLEKPGTVLPLAVHRRDLILLPLEESPE